MKTTMEMGAERSVWRASGIVRWVLAALAMLAFEHSTAIACGTPMVQARRLHVVVTVPPLSSVVRALSPEGSEVKVLMAPGRSEHGYEFTPTDLAAVAKADVLVYVGLGLEPRIEKEVRERPVTGRQVVCMAEALGIRAEEAGGHGDAGKGDAEKDKHEHAGHGEPGHVHDEHCNHGPVDQHLWLDPVLMERFVPIVAEAVKEAMRGKTGWPEKAIQDVDARAKELAARVRKVHEEYEARLKDAKGKAIVTHHNAFSRVAERYGFEVAESIREFDNSDPTPKEIADLVRIIREKKVTTIFVEPRYNAAIAERIAKAAKVKVGKLDPLGDGDWFKMMRGNLDELAKGFFGGNP